MRKRAGQKTAHQARAAKKKYNNNPEEEYGSEEDDLVLMEEERGQGSAKNAQESSIQ